MPNVSEWWKSKIENLIKRKIFPFFFISHERERWKCYRTHKFSMNIFLFYFFLSESVPISKMAVYAAARVLFYWDIYQSRWTFVRGKQPKKKKRKVKCKHIWFKYTTHLWKWKRIANGKSPSEHCVITS